MHIGIAGPIAIDSVASLLRAGTSDRTPVGYPGAPLMGTLIRALLERGHRVSAYTHSKDLWWRDEGPVVLDSEYPFQLTVVPVRPHAFRPSRGAPGRMLDVFRQERRELSAAITRDSPEVIHAHWTYEFALAALDSAKPHVITGHDSPLKIVKYTRSPYRLGRYFMARKVYGAARYLTVVSPYVKEQVDRYARTPIHVIGNPVPHYVIGDAPQARAGICDPVRPRLAMVLNGWAHFKNGPVGLAAFSLLRKKLPGATLHCFGAGYEPGGIAETWARSQGLAAGVEFIGPTPHRDLLQALTGIDVLLHPALEESCPLSLIEAMALGVPIVAGERSGGVPWVLDGGKAGVLTDVSSPDATYRSVLYLLQEAEYEKFIVAGLTRVNECFTPSAVAEQYEAVYKDALEGFRCAS